MTAFRDATEDDLPAIVRLLADDVFGRRRERPGEVVPDTYHLAFRAMTGQGGRIILAVQDGGIVGCLQFNILHGVSHSGRSRAQIESVRVQRERRGSGIGRALMSFAIAEAARHKCGMVQLTSQREREAAIRFYERLGFTVSHAGMKLHLHGAGSAEAAANEEPE